MITPAGGVADRKTAVSALGRPPLRKKNGYLLGVVKHEGQGAKELAYVNASALGSGLLKK